MKKKIVLIVIVLILIILIAIASVYVYRYNLLKNIGNAGIDFTESDNFYFEIIPSSNEEENNSNLHQQLYVKGDKSARYSLTNNTITQRFYIDTQNNTMTVVDEQNKSYFITNMETIVGNKGLSNLPEIFTYATSMVSNKYDFKSILGMLSSLHNISTEKEDNTEYIKISLEEKENNYNETVWLNKETLLPVKVEIGNNVRNYVFEKDNVTDEDVNFSETNYTLVEPNN